MNKLSVGDYVRTKDGLIGKYNIKKEYHTIPTWQGGNKCQEIEQQYINNIKYNRFDYEIIKSSPNIIDLIEIGDYINGLRVEKNKYGELYTSYVYYGGDIGKQCEVYTTWLKEYTEDMIYEVVTHEQFENISYKVGE